MIESDSQSKNPHPIAKRKLTRSVDLAFNRLFYLSKIRPGKDLDEGGAVEVGNRMGGPGTTGNFSNCGESFREGAGLVGAVAL